MKNVIKLASAVVGLMADIMLVLESVRRFKAKKKSCSNNQSNSKKSES